MRNKPSGRLQPHASRKTQNKRQRAEKAASLLSSARPPPSIAHGLAQLLPLPVLRARHKCSFSVVLEALTAILFGMMMIGQAAASAPDVSSSMVAARQIFRLLDRQSEIDPFGEGGEKPSDVAGAVALKDVEFNYPSRPDVPVLRGLTAAVAPGKTLALVGESGSGNSTVVSLLERFYDIASGSLTLDECEASLYNVGNLHSHLAIVSQEPDLFSMSPQWPRGHDVLAAVWQQKKATKQNKDTKTGRAGRREGELSVIWP